MILVVRVLAIFFISISSFAHAGVDSSGGGNESIAYFVGSAEALLEKIKFSPEHQRLLKDALKKSRIESVTLLRQPLTGKPVKNQAQMLAYSSPGLIQLKEASDSGDSWGLAVREKRSVAHIVIHELFRASGLVDKAGRSADDTFQLSVGRYKLNQVDSFGNKLDEPVELHFWKCQCFENDRAGLPDGGMNLIGISSLSEAESEAVRMCTEDWRARSSLARCHKFVGDPNQF